MSEPIWLEACESQRHLRRVVCAAIRFHDGLVICSPRHFDQVTQKVLNTVVGSPVRHWEVEQGFVDQRGVFMDRKEAWTVAHAAGQIAFRAGGDETDGGTLYSENLY